MGPSGVPLVSRSVVQRFQLGVVHGGGQSLEEILAEYTGKASSGEKYDFLKQLPRGQLLALLHGGYLPDDVAGSLTVMLNGWAQRGQSRWCF